MFRRWKDRGRDGAFAEKHVKVDDVEFSEESGITTASIALSPAELKNATGGCCVGDYSPATY